jgi:hypothetical protein
MPTPLTFYGAEIEDVERVTLSDLAILIRADWRHTSKNGVNYAAEPYLTAMQSLNVVNPREAQYGLDPGDEIVAYFLANATSWRGDVARSVKAELKRRLGR